MIFHLKVLAMTLVGQENPYHFQGQGKIHMKQIKQQKPCKIAEIMKKKRLLKSFILEGAFSSIMCGAFERKGS